MTNKVSLVFLSVVNCHNDAECTNAPNSTTILVINKKKRKLRIVCQQTQLFVQTRGKSVYNWFQTDIWIYRKYTNLGSKKVSNQSRFAKRVYQTNHNLLLCIDSIFFDPKLISLHFCAASQFLWKFYQMKAPKIGAFTVWYNTMWPQKITTFTKEQSLTPAKNGNPS